MADSFERYETGIARLVEYLGMSHPRYNDALILQSRLIENIDQSRTYGDSETRRAERAQITGALNKLASEELHTSFNQLCGPTLAAGEIRSSEHSVVDIGHLGMLFTDYDTPDPILLLGAGASQKSGVPLTDALVERAAKWGYCRAHQRVPDDPTVRRSDWLDWLRHQDWYSRQQSAHEQYVKVVSRLLPVEPRRKFFRDLSHPRVSPSSGYADLLRLMAAYRVRTVLTTNFDAVLPSIATTVPNPRRVTVVSSPDDYRFLSTAPINPQLVYLHGEAERYADCYFNGGYERLDEALVDCLVPLLRDHPLIVVGYGGLEPSILHDLLLGCAQRTYLFQHGLYWCTLPLEYPAQIPSLVTELGRTIYPNFHFVLIDSFDALLSYVSHSLAQASTPSPGIVTSQAASLLTSDMRIVQGATIDELDWQEIEDRLLAYCQKMEIAVPGIVMRDWLLDLMQSVGLLQSDDGGRLCPTLAGYLLFGKRPVDRLPNVRLEVIVSGEEPVSFVGNLWHQLGVIDLLDNEFNTPFRLKGRSSETVTPYPLLALKEVIVNALVHRSYDSTGTDGVMITVEGDRITVTNPGGLADVTRGQLPPGVPPEKILGIQPIKGYRNPVIADLLYSSGDMDKLGSGLIDVRKWMKQGGTDISIRLGPGNSFFQISLYRRPERPDANTGAASPLVLAGEYISNVLEVVELAGTVWSDTTQYRRIWEILRQNVDQPLPAFILHEDRLFCFADLSQPENPLRKFTSGMDVRSMALTEFAAGEDGSRRVVNLLNEALQNYVKRKGLVFDWKRKRAYYPRSDDGERTITYQSRLRRATRTVVKKRVSSVTNEVIYWEHQAVAFQYKSFGETWGLQLLPTYVFTSDGHRTRLPDKRGGPLATRRLSREYNIHVDSHLVFWTAVLSEGNPDICLEDTFGSCIRLRSVPSSCILRSLEPLPEQDGLPPPVGEELDELEDQLWNLAGDAEEAEDDGTDD